MATTRKRPTSSGFTPKEDITEEDKTTPEESLESAPVQEVVSPFVEEVITPTPDAGPRFSEDPTPPPAAVAIPDVETPFVIGKVPPKRHPRNTPKFSRYK